MSKLGLNPRQIEALKKASVNPNDILDNLDSLNNEIATLNGEQPSVPEKKEEVMSDDFGLPDPAVLAAENARLEREIAEKRAREAAEAAEAAEAEEEAEEPVDPREAMHNQIRSILANAEGAPSPQQIEALKERYKKVHVIALSEDDVFVFTFLRRGVWKQIQQWVEKEAQAGEGSAIRAEETLRQKVLQNTVLYPKGVGSPEFAYNSHAGLLDTLYEVVMFNSYFLNTQQAMALTVEL
jgi:predicted  nucleic acid-binding Zn-ribbon protein